MENIEEKLNNLLEDMLDAMGEGGMDTSYAGNNYGEAKKEAIKKIIKIIKKT